MKCHNNDNSSLILSESVLEQELNLHQENFIRIFKKDMSYFKVFAQIISQHSKFYLIHLFRVLWNPNSHSKGKTRTKEIKRGLLD